MAGYQSNEFPGSKLVAAGTGHAQIKEGKMKTVGKLLAPLVEDKRVGPAHVCLYLAIWQCVERQDVEGSIAIQREEMMRLAKMEGKTTYYRVMGDLARWGYIQYSPSRDKGGRSRVRVRQLTLPENLFDPQNANW